MRVLDLFSGIGGFSLGLQMAGGFEPVQFVEIDSYCQKVLAKNFPGVPIHGDIRTFSGVPADLICGGFPCQPFSHAGKRAGKDDDRDLWPEMARVIAAVRPTWVIGENVAGFIQMELDRCLSDLESLGYTCQAFVIPACSVDAPHRRDRVWIVGHSDSPPAQGGSISGGIYPEHPNLDCRGADKARILADFISRRQQGRRESVASFDPATPADRETVEPFYGGGPNEWSPEPGVGRVANGVPRRVDRLRGLGNAVVPQVVAEIGRAIRLAA